MSARDAWRKSSYGCGCLFAPKSIVALLEFGCTLDGGGVVPPSSGKSMLPLSFERRAETPGSVSPHAATAREAAMTPIIMRRVMLRRAAGDRDTEESIKRT